MYLKKIFIIIIILFISILAINKLIEKKAYLYLEDFLNSSQRIFIKKYLQPYKYISKQQKIITNYYNMESDFKKSNVDILVGKMKEKNLTNNKTIKRYNLVNGFYLGMNKVFPGSGFIDFDNDNLLVLSSRGVLGYTNDLENELNFKQIKLFFTHLFCQMELFCRRKLHVICYKLFKVFSAFIFILKSF